MVLLLVACINVPTGINDHLELLTASAEVASVTCTPSALEIAITETGVCSAFNADLTRLDVGGFSPVIWTSNDPTAVSVSMSGKIFAETVASSAVTITAAGMNGTIASFIVTTF